MNKEGFWYSKYEPDLPMPEPGVLTEDQAREIGSLIKKKQRSAGRKVYRGMAPSRLEKCYVGGAEYTSGNWKWPEGFVEHYVIKHKVKPTDEFLKFIGYEWPSAQEESNTTDST